MKEKIIKSVNELEVGDLVFLYPEVAGGFSWITQAVAFFKSSRFRYSHVGVMTIKGLITEASFQKGLTVTSFAEFVHGKLFDVMRLKTPLILDWDKSNHWLLSVLADAKARKYDTLQIFANLLNLPLLDDPKKLICSTLVRDYYQIAGCTLRPDLPRWYVKPNDLAEDSRLDFVFVHV